MLSNEIITAAEDASRKADKFGLIPSKYLSILTDIISASGEFSQFEDHVHTVGDSGITFTYEILSQKLARRTLQVGGEQAFAELQSYNASDVVGLFRALLLHHIHIDADYAFANGVQILSVENLPPSSLRDELLRRQFDYFVGGHVDTVMLVDYVPQKLIRSTADEKTDWSAMEVMKGQNTLLNDTRLMVSLARPPDFGIPVIAATTIFPECLNILSDGFGYNPYPEPRTAFGPPILEIEMQLADKLLQSFDELSDDTKDRIRVALKRLNDAKIDPDWANKAINLRICLENLFLKDGETTELTKRLSERAPGHTSFSNTRTKRVYGFLSGAVHTGKTQHHDTITEKEVATEVQKVIRSFILEGGYPMWK